MELAGKHPRAGEFYRALGDPVGRQPLERAARGIARGNVTAAVRLRRYPARQRTRTHRRNSAPDPGRAVGSVRRGGPPWTQAHHAAIQDAETGYLAHGLSELGIGGRNRWTRTTKLRTKYQNHIPRTIRKPRLRESRLPKYRQPASPTASSLAG